MKIFIEVDFEADYHESDMGVVSLQGLRFVGHQQNILHYLSTSEQDAAQQALEEEYEKAAIAKVERLREHKAMAGDRHRELALEIQQETLRELAEQRGVRI